MSILGPVISAIKVCFGFKVANKAIGIVRNSLDIGEKVGHLGGKVVKGTKNGVGKTVETVGNAADYTSTKVKIAKLNGQIKQNKYDIGSCIYEKKIVTNNKDIDNEIEKINDFAKVIKNLENEYKIAGGNVEELKYEIQKYNEQLEIIAEDQIKEIDNVVNTKEEVGQNISTRHEIAEDYIRKVIGDSDKMNEDLNFDNLIDQLDEME